MIRAIFLSLFLLVANVNGASTLPPIDLLEAVATASKYVRTNKIPNSERHLISAIRQENFGEQKKRYWAVTWGPNELMKLDAQLVVWVYDDGRITHRDSWA